MGIKRYAAAAAVAALTAGAIIAAPVSANPIGPGAGCTPGFWKNHTDWKSYDDNSNATADDFGPNTNVQDALRITVPGGYGDLGSWTTMQALNGKGGSTLYGAGQILLRASVSSYLNADAALDFPLRRFTTGLNEAPSMQSQIQAALDSKDRNQIVALATTFDGLNNANCPLS